MPNPDGSLSAEEALGMLDQPDDVGGSSDDGSLTPEQAIALQQGKPQVDPVQQRTSASAAAVADNSWFSPEFRSGALFKDVVQPVAAAARATAQALGRLVDEPTRQRALDYAGRSQMSPEETAAAVAKVAPYADPILQTAGKYANMSPPGLKETMPLYWMGKYHSLLARVLNPQGPAGARGLRTGLEAVGGFEEKGAEAVAGMVTPFNALLAVAPEALPARLAGLANKGLALAFLGQALGATPEQIRRFNAAKDVKEKAGIVAETMVSYAPALAFHARGKALRAAQRAEEQPTSEPVGTSEVPAPGIEAISSDQLRTWGQSRLDELAQKETELTPAEQAEVKDLQDGLKEGGDFNAMAKKFNVDLSDVTPEAEGEAAPVVETGGETNAEQPSNAQVETTSAAPGVKKGTTGAEPPAGDSDNVVGETQGEETGGAVPSETAVVDPRVTEAQQKLAELKAEADQQGAAFPEAKKKHMAALEKFLATKPEATEPVEELPHTATATGDQIRAVKAEMDTLSPGPRLDELNRWMDEVKRYRPGTLKRALGEEAPAGKLTPEELADLSHSQRAIYEETGELLTPEEAAKAQSAKARAGVVTLPTDLEAALAKAEQSGAERDAEGTKTNLKEARRLLAASKRLPKAARAAALNRIKRAELVVEGKAPPPTTAESDPNVIESNRKIYTRVGYDENKKQGIWKGSRGLVSQPGLIAGLDNKWEARKAIAEDAKEQAAKAKEKKAAPKTETTAAPVPTTAPEVSREEIGKGEAQPPAPGTKVKHWTWGEGEVVGPDPKNKSKTTVRFKDGSTMNFDTDVVVNKMTPKAEAPKVEPKPDDPAAKLRKEISDLRDKIIEDKNNAAKLKAKERVAANKAIKADQMKLQKLLKQENKLPKATPDESALTESQIKEREMFRKSLGDRVKKAKFDKSEFLLPSSTGGEAQVVPALSHRGLQIYKKRSNIKPWQVTHEGSGNLLGHFDSEADAKAFAVRIHEGTQFDFTRPWDSVKNQKLIYGTAKFREMAADPYAFLSDAGARLRLKLNKDKTGAFMLNEDIGPDIMEFGRRMYQRGMHFRDWAVNMVKHLGEKIIDHLNSIWDSITGRNIRPEFRERGGVGMSGGQKKKPAPGSGAAQPKPIVTASGAIVQPKYNPSAANAPAKVNAGTGGTIKPPPPGSALGPTPPGSNPHQVWWDRSISDWKKAWERYWPGMYAAHRLEPGTVVGSTAQRFIQGPSDGMHHMFHDEPWYQKMAHGLTRQQIIDAEYDARTKYHAFKALGQGELQATLNAIKGNPIRDYFVTQMNEMVKEKSDSGRLNVKMPGYIDGPYLPRLTDGQNLPLIKIGGSREGVVSQLRRSLGHFADSRTYDTMKEGIANHVNYREPIEAVIQRRRVGEQLHATARALDDLIKGGVLYRDRAAAETYAKATYKPKDVDVIRMDGFGGDTWWVRNRQEARAIDQNLNNSSPHSQWATFMQVVNNYARNPNLWNPAPHVTKNMFFKYVLARLNNLSLKGDTPEFKRMTRAEKIDLFHTVFPMPGDQPGKIRLLHSERVPEMIAGESKRWFDKVTRQGMLLNRPSQKFIFEKADPWLRYKLWESYFRKGMSAQESAGHVLFDLIRYDENSGALNLYKSIPFNFFSTWRTGTYVTIYKAMKTHPIRTLMFFGAVEYMREMIYRKTGKWTHLPIDYLMNPLAEMVEGMFKAKREVALGRNPFKAYATVAGKGAGITLTTAAFGPGGSQAPTTIKDLMGALQGDEVAMTRVFNMFWGLSQLFNIPQEFMAFQRDKKPEHLVNILTGAAFGTHDAISYEPRRMGKWIPESMPGMAIPQEMKNYAVMRQGAEDIGTRAAITHERRFGIFNWANQGSKEKQVEQLLRRRGLLKEKRQPGVPSGYPRRGP